jgi:hypothetical protein
MRRKSDEKWKARNIDLLPSIETQSMPSLQANVNEEMQEDELFQKLQLDIQKQRQRNQHKDRRKRSSKHKKRHQRKEKRNDDRNTTLNVTNNDDHDSIYRMEKSLNSASKRVKVSNHDSRTHLLQLITSALTHVSTNVSPGPLIGLLDSINSAVIALTENDPLDPIIKKKKKKNSKAVNAQEDDSGGGPGEVSTIANRSFPWRSTSLVGESNAKRRKENPTQLLTKIHQNLNDVVRNKIQYIDWAEDLLKDNLLSKDHEKKPSSSNTTITYSIDGDESKISYHP